MKALLKTLFAIFVFTSLLQACADDNFTIPDIECKDANLKESMSLEKLCELATASPAEYTADDLVSGYVISSDQGGHFFKELYLVSEDQTQSIRIAVDATKLFSDYGVGRKVFVKLKGLYVQKLHGVVQLGSLYKFRIGRILDPQYKSHLTRSCTTLAEEDFVSTISIEEAQASDRYVGQLIELEDVEFESAVVGKNFYHDKEVIGGQTNRLLVDRKGRTLIFRTGSYADFAAHTIPEQSGRIRGVLTKYNDSFQFIARYAKDIALTEERFATGKEAPTSPHPAEGPEQPTDAAPSKVTSSF